MPWKPAPFRPRLSPGQKPRLYDQRRGSSTERGYGSRWQKYRGWYLKQHPLCVECGHLATVVDHITPVLSAEDPLFYEPTNHQSLCASHHNAKSQRDRAAKLTRNYG